jgi:hypothetical protein
MQTPIKLLLSLLLLLCLVDMPYGYYQFVRFISSILFAYFAYVEREKNTKWMVFYIAMAILFQPFLKISLGRELWNVVDVIVTFILVITVFNKKENS